MPRIKTQQTSGSYVKIEDTFVTEKPGGFYDEHGLNKLMVETTIHAHCNCTGTLKHFLRKSLFKPTLVIECTAHGQGCNIGRRKAINLTKACTIDYKSKQYQCSAAAVKLIGSVFENGFLIENFVNAIRQSG